MNDPKKKQAMESSLDGARLARLPAQALGVLGGLRDRTDVTVGFQGERAIVRWEPADDPTRDPVLQALLPIPDATFYRPHGEERWQRVAHLMPAFDIQPPPADQARPLYNCLLPATTRWEWPRSQVEPTFLRLSADRRSRPTTAVRVPLQALREWSDQELRAKIEATRASRSGDRILLVGRSLPSIPHAERFWGHHVLVPIGFQLVPELPEPVMVEALGMPDGSLALVDHEMNVEFVSTAALETLTRSSLRLMIGPDDRLRSLDLLPKGEVGAS